VIPAVLSNEDVEYLKMLFHSIVKKEWEKREALAEAAGRPKPRRLLDYFTLLRYLNVHKPRDNRLDDILLKLRGIIEKQFGPGFVIVNDFWSWRSATSVAAERIHMDSDFWMTKQHDGFNLWLLLDHKDMPYSFDIFTQAENPELYQHVGLPHHSTWLLPEEDPKRCVQCPGILFWEPLSYWPMLYDMKATRSFAMAWGVMCMKWWAKTQAFVLKAKKLLPTWLFRLLVSVTGWATQLSALPGGIQLKAKRFGLDVGDALVVRQHELHGTDQDRINDDMYRLALGLKVMKQAEVRQYAYTGPAPKSRRAYPGLRLPLGQRLRDVYNVSREPHVDMELVRESGLGLWLAEMAKERFAKATE